MPAARRVHAGEGVEGRDRPAGALPHARHERHRGGERARGDRCGRRRRRRRARLDERADFAAESRLDRRGVAPWSARHRRRSPRTCACCPAYWEQVRHCYGGVRERSALRRVRGLRARHAGRSVHEPARAGALARHRRRALAGSGARVRAGQRDVRRHRQGDADLEGRRRHGADDGDERAHARAGARSRTRRSRFRNRSSRCSAAISVSRTAASRRRCRRRFSRARSR